MVAITGVRKYVDNFTQTFPGAPRLIQEVDVLRLCELNLIKTHGCFSRDDYKTVLSILKYEQCMMGPPIHTDVIIKQPADRQHSCKLCTATLPNRAPDGIGRPKEYCGDCQRLRSRDRNRRWRQNRLYGS